MVNRRLLHCTWISPQAILPGISSFLINSSHVAVRFDIRFELPPKTVTHVHSCNAAAHNA